MKKGYYKLALSKGRRCHFAVVEIQVVNSIKTEVVFSEELIILNSQWKKSSEKGVKDFLDVLGINDTFTIKILKMEGTIADTTEHSIWLASTLALANALHYSEYIQSIELNGDYWELKIKNFQLTSNPHK